MAERVGDLTRTTHARRPATASTHTSSSARGGPPCAAVPAALTAGRGRSRAIDPGPRRGPRRRGRHATGQLSGRRREPRRARPRRRRPTWSTRPAHDRSAPLGAGSETDASGCSIGHAPHLRCSRLDRRRPPRRAGGRSEHHEEKNETQEEQHSTDRTEHPETRSRPRDGERPGRAPVPSGPRWSGSCPRWRRSPAPPSSPSWPWSQVWSWPVTGAVVGADVVGAGVEDRNRIVPLGSSRPRIAVRRAGTHHRSPAAPPWGGTGTARRRPSGLARRCRWRDTSPRREPDRTGARPCPCTTANVPERAPAGAGRHELGQRRGRAAHRDVSVDGRTDMTVAALGSLLHSRTLPIDEAVKPLPVMVTDRPVASSRCSG